MLFLVLLSVFRVFIRLEMMSQEKNKLVALLYCFNWYNMTVSVTLPPDAMGWLVCNV